MMEGANGDLFTSKEIPSCRFCAKHMHSTMADYVKSVSLKCGGDFIGEWLELHPEYASDFVKNWLSSHPQAAQEIINRYYPSTPASIMPLKGPPKTNKKKLLCQHISSPAISLHQYQKRPMAELRKLDRSSLFYELLTDVVSPNLNVNQLTHKILVNVLVLTNSDRSSLFMVEGPEDNRILVSRLFDITVNTPLEKATHEDADSIKIALGVGIAGTVAMTGETINLKDAYEDSRFYSKVDVETGFQTKSILCMPIKTTDGQVIGVAQVINKDHGESVFTSEDEEYFRMYLKFCAIGLTNSQLLDHSFSLSKRLHILLQLARDLFEDTTNLELVMTKVMQESMELIPCQHCSVLLLDMDSKEKVAFSHAFQVTNPQSSVTMATNGHQRIASMKSLNAIEISDMCVVEYVAKKATPVVKSSIIPTCDNQSPTTSMTLPLEKETKSILCVPISNKDGLVLGIVKLTNKLNFSYFNKADLESLEVFATFCGLVLHNAMMYEKISVANARNRVAFDVLSYHVSSSAKEANRLMQLPILPDSYKLTSLKFDDLTLSDNETVLGSVRIFIDSGLVETFKLNTQVLYRWLLSVKKNYRPVTYHNWRHAFNVAQTMFSLLAEGELGQKLTKLEQLALIVACFCHDLDHRGTNNAFQVKSGSALAQLYTTSTMEHHHFDHCIMILNSEGNGLLDGLSSSKYTAALKMLESAILSTDLALHFKKKQQFQDIVTNKTFNWNDSSNRDLLRGMLMTACDVAAITKPWAIQRRVANMVASEFFEQGDLERSNLQVEPSAMMDRRKKDELPKMQVGFIDFLCIPLYKMLADLVPSFSYLHDGVIKNRKNWQLLVEDPKAVIQDKVMGENSGNICRLPINSAWSADDVSKIEGTRVKCSNNISKSLRNTIETVESTSCITTTIATAAATKVTVISPNSESRESVDLSNLPIQAWRSNSLQEDHSGGVKLLQDKNKMVRPSTHVEVMSRKRHTNCTVS